MRNRTLTHIMAAANEQVWAMLPSKLAEIRAFLEMRMDSTITLEELRQDISARVVGPNDVPVAQRSGSTAVIPVFGVVAHRMSMFYEISGGTSTEALIAKIEKEAGANDVESIVLDFNSPGGVVEGIPEAVTAIANAKAKKPVVGFANAMSASAAYWLMSACTECVVTPSGQVGSIGVYGIHQDLSKAFEAEGITTTLVKAGKFKAEGLPYFPLGAEAEAAWQEKVNEFYGMFVDAVADGRKTTAKEVKENFGGGRMLTANAAKAAGMVDRIETMGETLSRLNRKGGAARAFNKERAALEATVFDMGGKLTQS